MKVKFTSRVRQALYKIHRRARALKHPSLLLLHILKSRIFHPPSSLFLHIQKTAGSSLVYLLREIYYKSFIIYGEYVGKHPDELGHLSFVSGHFGYDYAKTLMPSRYTFTFLRHPGERILSLYYFCRTRNPDQFPLYRIAQECDLEKFLETGFAAGMAKEHIWNHQAWQLAHGWGSLTNKTLEDFSPDEILDLARAHLQEFSYVGLTETFDEDCKNILKSLKLYCPEKMAVENATVSRQTVADISPKARELLAELTCLDQKLYDEVVNRRTERGHSGK